MSDYTDDDERDESRSDVGDGIEEEPPIYRSGRVRIIGAEPAGDAVHEATGPVSESHPDMPHWNDAPTGQVPAILDRGGSNDEPHLAPPTWREESADWEAHEESFEPAMLSDDLDPLGALDSGRVERVDVERQPWRFESELTDDTLIVEPEYPADPGTAIFTPEAPGDAMSSRPAHAAYEPPISIDSMDEPEPEPEAAEDAGRGGEDLFAGEPVSRTSRLVAPRRRGAAQKTPLAAASAQAGSRLKPPRPPQPVSNRTPRTTRVAPGARNKASAGGTGGRDMRVAIGSGVILGGLALGCFALGSVASMVIATLVVFLAAAEAFSAFRRAQYHPATLLGLVAVVSLMFETYNKGVSALPLIIVLLVAGTFIWFLARVEPSADPVAGIVSTLFVFGWVGGFGSFAGLLLNPSLFPQRHGIAYLLAAVVITVAADVTSLLVGSAFGSHPMAPSISPNKSWEGFVGGAVAAVLAAVIVVHFIHPWTVGKAAVLGLVIAVVAPVGDLSQSMIKRHLGIKDMASILPGHGGFLDRVDGLLFALPATYFVVKAFHLG
jgi:CDP-diglyceride synthetase